MVKVIFCVVLVLAVAGVLIWSISTQSGQDW